MPKEKNICIREMVIDYCLSDHYQKYTVAEMMDACNAELCKEGAKPVTSLNTIRTDIQHISEKWAKNGGEIVQQKIGRNIYYSYADPTFRIYRTELSEEDMVNLRQLVFIFHRLQGSERYSWVEDMVLRIESQILLQSGHKQIVGFDVKDLTDATGTKFLLPLFNSIIHKKVTFIEYRSFERSESQSDSLATQHLVHPYFLKEYKYRWYLVGFAEDKEDFITLSLDRIKHISETDNSYIENTTLDFKEFFEKVIGVTIIPYKEVEYIRIRVSSKQYKYFEKSPIHPSQQLEDELADGSRVISIWVKENYELYQELLSYGAEIQVLEPTHIRNELKKKLKDALDHY